MAYASVQVKPTDRWLVGLSTDAKPTPDPEEATHHLMESDTGNIYMNTGSTWLQTHQAGVALIGINPDGDAAALEIDSLGHLNTLNHAHAEGGHVLLEAENLGVGTFYFTLIDLSDTTNYPHDNTGWVHMANLTYHIDAGGSTKYSAELGFLENVTATESDFHHVLPVAGTKSSGLSKDIILTGNPEAPKMRSESFTGRVTVETEFDLATSHPSSIDSTVNQNVAGENDVVLIIEVTSGSVNLALSMGYHSHS